MTTVVEADAPPDLASAPVQTGVPRWFLLLAVVPALVLACVGGTALALAMVGAYHLWLTLLIGLPITAVFVVAVVRRGPERPVVGRQDVLGAMGAVLVAVLALGYSGSHPSQHVLIDRDPGAYADIARWISRDGSLRVDADQGGYDGAAGVVYFSAAVYQTGGQGNLEFQFNHLTSAALAVAYDVGGTRALFRLPALVGALALLPLYAFARRVLRGPWLALAATAAMACSLPFLSVVKDTYSEPFTMMLLWGGMLALVALLERPTVRWAGVAGLLVGATVMTRIDGVAYLFPLPLIAAFLWVRRERKPAITLLLAALVPTIVGTLDVRYLSGLYINALATQRRQLDLALLLITVVSVVGVALRRQVGRLLAALDRRSIALVAGALVTLAFLAGWIVRPLVQTAHQGPSAPIAVLQKAEGSPVDITRSYAEQSLRWMGWYLGPITVAAIAIGCGLIVIRLLRRCATPSVWILTAFLALAGVIYIWTPSITPEHIWVMRRFVPLILPAFLVVAALCFDDIIAAVTRWWRGRASQVVLVVLASGLLVVPPVVVLAPVHDFVDQAHFLEPVQAACRDAGPDAAFAIAGPLAITLPQALRSWCGATAAELVATSTPADLRRLATRWAAECKELVLITTTPQSALPFASVTKDPRATPGVVNHHLLDRTVEHRPSKYDDQPLTLYLATVDVPLTCPAGSEGTSGG